MRRLFVLAASLAIVLTACATHAKRVKLQPDQTTVPAPAQGEVAVFGKIRLMEKVLVRMPADEQDGAVYLRQMGSKKTYRVKCSNSGDFGVYLPTGSYRLTEVDIDRFTFKPEDVRLNLQQPQRAVYAGTVVLDGAPSGIEPNSGDTKFIITVKDEYRDFVEALRKASPGSESQVGRQIFKAGSAIAVGDYPDKVHRAKDVSRNLEARTDAVEEVVSGGIVVLTYVINPIWLLAIP